MNWKILAFGMLFFVFFVFFVVTTLITPILVLADANDTVTIDVNVTESASIIVLPETLNWTGVATGQPGGIKQLTVKNAGSLNVSQIYAYIDTLEGEPSRPYGSSDPLDFSAGGVIAMRNETDINYTFVGRIEWNWTQDIPNHNWGAVTSPISWGYFRNTSNDYVWVLGNGTGGRCNESDAEFAIENEIDLGITTTRTPIGGASYPVDTQDSTWAYISVNDAGSPLYKYCVAAYWDCTKIYIYHYDKRTSPNFNGCNNAEYLQQANLTPGYTIVLDTDAWVPSGYPAGYLNQTTLTIYASSS